MTQAFFASTTTTMPPPATQAMKIVQRFRIKEIRAPSIKHLTPYRAPIPKPIATDVTPPTALPETKAKAKNKGHEQPNPFLARYNTETGRWAPAKYSLRQQARLIKAAKASNTLHLLPPGPKLSSSEIASFISQSPPSPEILKEHAWAQEKAVKWEGEPKPLVAGADIGNRLYAGKKRMFKGHKWERTMAKKEKRRKMLLGDMKKRVIRYKGVSAFFRLVCVILMLGWNSIITGGDPIRSNRPNRRRVQNYRSRGNQWTIANYLNLSRILFITPTPVDCLPYLDKRVVHRSL